jgi:hypothetical protein
VPAPRPGPRHHRRIEWVRRERGHRSRSCGDVDAALMCVAALLSHLLAARPIDTLRAQASLAVLSTSVSAR